MDPPKPPSTEVKSVERETLKARITGISGGFKKKKQKSMWETFVFFPLATSAQFFLGFLTGLEMKT